MKARELHLHSLTCTVCRHNRRYTSTVRNKTKTETNLCTICQKGTPHTVSYLGKVVER